MPARHACLTALALCLLGTGAWAQKLSVAPAPGLWENSHKVLLNGVDVLAVMRGPQAQVLAQALKGMTHLPPEQRALLEQVLKAQSAAQGDGLQRECLTPEQSRQLADPAALIRRLNEDAENSASCRFELVSASGNTIQLRGQCSPEDGWVGTMQGSMTLHDPQRWSSRFTGTGRLQGNAAAGVGAAGSAADAVMEGSGRWVAASCGEVPPRN